MCHRVMTIACVFVAQPLPCWCPSLKILIATHTSLNRGAALDAIHAAKKLTKLPNESLTCKTKDCKALKLLVKAGIMLQASKSSKGCPSDMALSQLVTHRITGLTRSFKMPHTVHSQEWWQVPLLWTARKCQRLIQSALAVKQSDIWAVKEPKRISINKGNFAKSTSASRWNQAACRSNRLPRARNSSCASTSCSQCCSKETTLREPTIFRSPKDTNS